jgi:hypothetical protein
LSLVHLLKRIAKILIFAMRGFRYQVSGSRRRRRELFQITGSRGDGLFLKRRLYRPRFERGLPAHSEHKDPAPTSPEA